MDSNRKETNGIKKGWERVKTPFAAVPVIAAMEAYRGRTLYGKSNFSVLTSNPGEEQEELAPSNSMGFEDVIVIHPGTSTWRIGRASDAFPKEFSSPVARRISVPPEFSEMFDPASTSKESDYSQWTAVSKDGVPESTPWKTKALEQDLKTRLRYNKIRTVPQGHQLSTSWNQLSTPETIPDHNDPNRIDWTEPAKEEVAIVGPRALKIPGIRPFPPTAAQQRCTGSDCLQEWCLFRPIVSGHFNDRDYVSFEACTNDIELVWAEAIKATLNLSLHELEEYKCVIVLPDSTDKLFVETMMHIALTQLRFKSAQPVQESVCASFGSSFSLCCVIDIGSSCTRVACVEDGVVVPTSRQMLPYGGDDITEFFQYLLRSVAFPYHELDVTRRMSDFLLLDQLKQKWCTADEFTLSMSIYDFYVRLPNQRTKKYQAKLYDELINASMCLYFPQVVRFSRKLFYWKTFESQKSWYDDRYRFYLSQAMVASEPVAPSASASNTTVSNVDEENDGNMDDTKSTSTDSKSVKHALEKDSYILIDGHVAETVMPLDLLILDCLTKYADSIQDSPDACDRVKKVVGSFLLVGGGGNLTGFAAHLEARLNLYISDWWAQLPIVQKRKAAVEALGELTETLKHGPQAMVVQNPREIDPTVLVWKGAAVLGKLDLAREMFTGAREWEDAGMDRLQTKWLMPVDV